LEVPSEEIERRAGLLRLGLREGTLEAGTGVKSRRFAGANEHPSTLATAASQRLLERLKMDKSDVGGLLFAANTMDETEPITAMRVHESLGLRKDVFVADIRDACNSALKAMVLASGLIRSGMVPNVLVAVGERLHDGIYLNVRSKYELVTRHLAGLTLGDAGAAVMLSSQRSSRCFEMVYQSWEVDSSKRDLARIEAGGTRCLTDPEKIFFISNAKKLCQVAVDKLPSMVRQVCGQLGWELSSIGVIPHQVSKGVITTIAKICGIPLRNLMITLDRFGNTGAATIPMALALAFENGFARNFRRIILVGGAAGFSGAVLALEFFSHLESLSRQLEQFSERLERAPQPSETLS
ncbi:MAG: 3-oxoacyl-ACP synthase III family protein, partial [Candidatus Binatia bacterium]